MNKKEKSEEEIIIKIKEINSRIDDLIERNRKLPLLF